MLQAEWGIAPEQVVDFQALVGDSVDNVPGVPLIGPKFARQLLEQYGTLEAVLDHAGEVPGAKRKENLLKFRDQALLSRELVRLDAHVPMAIDWNAGRPGRIDLDAALALFHDFGFRSIGQKLAALVKREGQGREARERAGHCSAQSEQRRSQSEARSLGTESRTLQASRHSSCRVQPVLRSPSPLTSSTRPRRSRRSSPNSGSRSPSRSIPRRPASGRVGQSWSACRSPGTTREAWYLPLRSPEGERHLDPPATLAALKPILEDPAVEKIGQNLKYDMIVLRAAGIELAGVAFDTMVASYLLEAGRRNHNLDELAQTYLHHETIKISELIGKGKDQRRMDEVPTSAAWPTTPPRTPGCRCGCGRSWPKSSTRPNLSEPARARSGTAADRRAGRVGVQRHQGRRGSAGRVEPPLRPADGVAGGGDSPDGGPAG